MNTNRGIFWVARSELMAFADGRASQRALDGILRARRAAQPGGQRRHTAGGSERAGWPALVPHPGWCGGRRSGDRGREPSAAAGRRRTGRDERTSDPRRARFDLARARSARRPDRVHRAHVPRAGQRALSLSARRYDRDGSMSEAGAPRSTRSCRRGATRFASRRAMHQGSGTSPARRWPSASCRSSGRPRRSGGHRSRR